MDKQRSIVLRPPHPPGLSLADYTPRQWIGIVFIFSCGLCALGAFACTPMEFCRVSSSCVTDAAGAGGVMLTLAVLGAAGMTLYHRRSVNTAAPQRMLASFA